MVPELCTPLSSACYSSPEIILAPFMLITTRHNGPSCNDHADLWNQLWHECAGLTVKVPQIGERVFYFPQGHHEQIEACMEDEDDITIHNYDLPPKILFKVVNVELKAYPDSDEVYAKFLLLPDNGEGDGSTVRSVPQKIPASSFRKILSVSDASTHGGCVLPKLGVEKTFPPLDASQDQASQPLVAKDLHGAEWGFQHVYRGSPKRHMLVNGWNKFASAKRLKAGDTCIFMRGLERNEIYIGIQRAVSMQKASKDLTGSAMRRGVLVDASVSMTTKTYFTVIYHPRMCCSAFIVPYHVVMEALSVNYSAGMRFETLDDPEDMSRKFYGIITANEDVDPARWPNSEWRCLKVQWDVAPFSHLAPRRVCPWDIQPRALDVPHMPSSISVNRKRSMPFEPVIRSNPLSRTNENNQSDGSLSLALTLSVGGIGGSSRQNETNLAEDVKVGEDKSVNRTMVSNKSKGKEVCGGNQNA
ncbi:putative transcription factor ARF family [Helianthus annuus]|uniref:Auxin response factor n=2 Tax=Helianthus annuus TaxID=4232 RepID=A0A9K3IDP7_HELAN|nr:putative transcription factor ARF family [Helianthus annuus]KAJ0546452.1 putative transcription factor ARF family [Helianthus annuus]KAJ0553179.1 putative transcription factor ARF family [Helianthus annuus]KAJ0722090.1 putative transcription factor ARF family [Helianthus annuus]KAJ0897434.1 putative transcription factor ARF family [Helianthus annuus]